MKSYRDMDSPMKFFLMISLIISELKMICKHWKEYNFIQFPPTTVTSKRHTIDMGIIACPEVGYNTIILIKVSDIFYAEGGYELASDMKSKEPNGCKGLEFGVKPTILDMMNIMHRILKTIVNIEKWVVSNAVGGRPVLFIPHVIMISTKMLAVITFQINIRLLAKRNVTIYAV